MNIDSLLNYYFKDCNAQPLIEVFDTENIYNVYSDIVKSLTNYPDIELSVMQALSYCFYEVLDNPLRKDVWYGHFIIQPHQVYDSDIGS